jgi:hypothetical protein
VSRSPTFPSRFLTYGLTSSVFSYMEEWRRPVDGDVRKQGKFSRILIQNHGTKITER